VDPYWYPLAIPTIGEAEINAAVAVLRTGKTTMGENVERFEHEFADYVGAQHAVMVNSGSSADLLIAFATGGPRGSVLLPAVTWPTHVWSWAQAGFQPCLVDVEGLNATPATLSEGLNAETVGVSIPHLMGVPARIDKIAEALPTCWVTEDCCEALGAAYEYRPVGQVGHAAAWSFFFSHHMTTMEGGMVTTNSGVFANRVRSMRSHGWARDILSIPDLDPRYTFIDQGFNLRPTEVEAAIGLVQLNRWRNDHSRRRLSNFKAFKQALHTDRVSLPEVPRHAHPSWFGIPMFVDDMPSLRTHLEAHGVETRPILGGNLARQPAFGGVVKSVGELPGADYLHDHGLYIGLHPGESEVEKVAKLINRWAKL
jgi:CDP-6-deoxy-D-xylo-4-hexulose-3-dehydrase